MFFFLIGFVSALFKLLLFYNFYWKRRHLPPGPAPFPIVGNLLELGKSPPGYDIFLKWRKQFGPIYTYWVGERPMVAFTDFETINETIVRDGVNYTDRDFFQQFYLIVRGLHGLVHMEGKLWKEHRKFLMTVFRNLGVGKNVLEQKVLSEFGALCQNVDRTIEECGDGEDMEIISYLDSCVGSIINSLLFGYQFNGKENVRRHLHEKTEEFVELKQILNEYMLTTGQPACQFLMAWWPRLQKIQRTYQFFERQIAEHERITVKMREEGKNGDGEEGEDVMNFVSAFFREMRAREGKDSFNIKTLYAHLLDFWIAGQKTTTDTLNWGIIHIIHNPKEQKMLHAELDAKICWDRLISLADKKILPYANAVVNEVMRISNVLPQNLARRTVENVRVRGHLLPKGTSIQPLISCVLYDENVFPNARQFNPERFLTPEGTLRQVDELIPFSVGKRFCAGESMARAELFLILVNLFNQYQIDAPKYSPMPSKQQNFGLSVVPLPYKCQIRKRH